MIAAGIKHTLGQDSRSWNMNNGCTHVGYLILADDRLSSALTSLENTLFLHDHTGFNDFYHVITRIFRNGMVQISHHHSTGGNITVELMCEYCCRYVIVEDVNSRWDSTDTELQEARATLLSFFSGCPFIHPQSNLLQQRGQYLHSEQFELMD